MNTSPGSGLIALVVIAAGFIINYLFQRGRSNQYDYCCGQCEETFSLSPLTGAFAPHRMGGRKWVRCPHCGALSWATPIPKG